MIRDPSLHTVVVHIGRRRHVGGIGRIRESVEGVRTEALPCLYHALADAPVRAVARADRYAVLRLVDVLDQHQRRPVPGA
jgi:hypothetical protein